MRRDGLLHPELLAVVASLGHGQSICIADPGLPVASDVAVITLAYAPGRPPFLDVLEVLLAELVVESALIATELQRDSHLAAGLSRLLDAAAVPVEMIVHEDLKAATHDCVAIVRTGEFTPYANVILTAGVAF